MKLRPFLPFESHGEITVDIGPSVAVFFGFELIQSLFEASLLISGHAEHGRIQPFIITGNAFRGAARDRVKHDDKQDAERYSNELWASHGAKLPKDGQPNIIPSQASRY